MIVPDDEAIERTMREHSHHADAGQQAALERLCEIASTQDAGQARRIADFLLSWHNAAENGGWSPVDLWSLDCEIADDILIVLRLIRESHSHPDEFIGKRIESIWQTWRGGRKEPKE